MMMLVPARGNMASVSVTAFNEAIGQGGWPESARWSDPASKGIVAPTAGDSVWPESPVDGDRWQFSGLGRRCRIENGSVGEVIGVRMPSGRVISGVVSASGAVEVRF